MFIDTVFILVGVTSNLDDKPYIFHAIVDMGAYEREYMSLTVSSTSGGSVTMPGEGFFWYEDGQVV